MSAPLTAEAAQTVDLTAQAAVQDRTRRRLLRRVLLWGGALLLVSVVLGLVLASAPPPATTLDPESTKPTGARALARVLGDRGIEVDIARSIGDVEDADAGPGTTVVVTAPDRLGPDALARFRDVVDGVDRLVLVAPRTPVLDGLSIPARTRVAFTATPLAASCTTPLVRAGERVTGATTAYAPDGGGWTACFPATNGAGYHLLVGRPGAGPEVVLVGHSRALTNGVITEEADAAYALRLLGHSPRLLWYHPGTADLPSANGEPQGLVFPDWFGPLVTLLGSGVVLLGLVVSRRLGRVVVEPLPVVVRAIETTEGRGRLYRRAADRLRTAETLRAGTRRRLAQRAGLGRGHVAPDALVEATARATGIAPDRVRAILFDPVDDSDHGLVTLAADLTDLETKVATR